MDPEEIAFLNAIALHPSDETARGAFADWWDDRDKPRMAAWWRNPVVVWNQEKVPGGDGCGGGSIWRPSSHVILPGETEGYHATKRLEYILALCGVSPKTTEPVIRVWPYPSTPGVLMSLVGAVGKECWVALFPGALATAQIDWIQAVPPYSVDVGQVDAFSLADGWEVRCGSASDSEDDSEDPPDW